LVALEQVDGAGQFVDSDEVAVAAVSVPGVATDDARDAEFPSDHGAVAGRAAGIIRPPARVIRRHPAGVGGSPSTMVAEADGRTGAVRERLRPSNPASAARIRYSTRYSVADGIVHSYLAFLSRVDDRAEVAASGLTVEWSPCRPFRRR
jgi:hypothetical protein